MYCTCFLTRRVLSSVGIVLQVTVMTVASSYITPHFGKLLIGHFLTCHMYKKPFSSVWGLPRAPLVRPWAPWIIMGGFKTILGVIIVTIHQDVRAFVTGMR